MDYGLSNMKCEFDEEETKNQFGVFENQLHEENADNKSSLYITKLQNDEDGELPGSFQKNQPISVKFSQVKIEYSEINEESNISLDFELSKIKCEFDEEETKIQYGVSEEPLHEEKITPSQYLEGANSQKSVPTILELALKRDQEIQKGEEPYKCETSSKCVTDKIGDRSFQCETCGQCFRTKKRLSAHLKIHTEGKPYKCEICGQCFNRKENLNTHMRIHTGDKPYKCGICGQCFTVKQNLDTHMRIHTGEKPYKCETCGQCFSIKKNLNTHLWIHTEEKPYKCGVCGKCFSRKQDFNSHMLIHRGVKPFKCETCGHSFTRNSNLSRHMRIHR